MTQFLQAATYLPDRCGDLDARDVYEAAALGFMPRIFVLTTLPHRRPEGHRFERVNGRQSLRLSAAHRVGLPFGTYPRLILAFVTTEAVLTKSPEIYLGATANDLARKLGLSTISGPRATAQRLEDQLRRLLSMRLDWQTSLGLTRRSSGSAFVSAGGTWLLNRARQLLPRRPTWRSQILLGQDFFEEITRSAVPVDLRAIRHLRRSPLAIDLYVWLTYRMSYLKKPTLIPWRSLEAQFGAGYSRPRDFRARLSARLLHIVEVYPTVRLRTTSTGLWLLPSPPHVAPRSGASSGLRT